MITITIFATQANTECTTREQFDALIAGSIQRFEDQLGSKLRRRADSDGVVFTSEIDYKLVEKTAPGAQYRDAAGNLVDTFSVQVEDQAGVMRWVEQGEITRAMKDIIAEFEI